MIFKTFYFGCGPVLDLKLLHIRTFRFFFFNSILVSVGQIIFFPNRWENTVLQNKKTQDILCFDNNIIC